MRTLAGRPLTIAKTGLSSRLIDDCPLGEPSIHFIRQRDLQGPTAAPPVAAVAEGGEDGRPSNIRAVRPSANRRTVKTKRLNSSFDLCTPFAFAFSASIGPRPDILAALFPSFLPASPTQIPPNPSFTLTSRDSPLSSPVFCHSLFHLYTTRGPPTFLLAF